MSKSEAGEARTGNRRCGRPQPADGGPPGTGKTMLAQRLPGILPPMTQQEAVESAANPVRLQQRLRCQRLEAPALSCATPYRFSKWHWSAAAASASRRNSLAMHACCSSMNCRNSNAACWKCCGTAGIRAHHRVAGGATGGIPRAVSTGGGDESLSLRLSGSLQQPLPLHAGPGLPRYRSRISGLCSTVSTCRSKCRRCRRRNLTQKPHGESSATVRARTTAARERALVRQQRPTRCWLAVRSTGTVGPMPKARPCSSRPIARLGLSARAYHRILRWRAPLPILPCSVGNRRSRCRSHSVSPAGPGMSAAPRHAAPVTLRLLAMILAALAMIGPFTIDTYLPSSVYRRRIAGHTGADAADFESVTCLPSR